MTEQNHEESFDVPRFMLTPAGRDLILAELHDLQERHERQQAELNEVQNHTGGDNMLEQAAYYEAITMKQYLEQRIGHLRYVLQHADVPQHDPDVKRIDPGERVILWDFQQEREIALDVLSGPEVLMQGEIGEGVQDVSVDSPIGKALLGCQVGDVIEVDIPDGHVKYAIRRIEQITD